MDQEKIEEVEALNVKMQSAMDKLIECNVGGKVRIVDVMMASVKILAAYGSLLIYTGSIDRAEEVFDAGNAIMDKISDVMGLDI